MRTTSFLRKILPIIVVSTLSISCNAKPDWNGIYSYETTEGNTVGGSPISMKYSLIVDKHKCSLAIEGYQTIERIRCKAAADKNTLHIQFQSYENGSLKNEFGVQVYKVNETLFNLTINKAVISTTWKAEKPDDSLPQEGVYFIKH